MIADNLEIYISEDQDVFLNLAREEHLFNTLPENTMRFMLYVNTSAIVIGRHQNPWIESPVGLLKHKEIKVARRISGGGTVYHDQGNLNFSFIHQQKDLSKEAYCEFIVKALSSLGISAQSNDRGDVLVNGKKISGHARCFKHGKGIHHGTLLVDSNLKKLGFSLKGLKDQISGLAIISVPSPVLNIIEVSPTLTIETAIEAFCNQFTKTFATTAEVTKLTRRNDPMKITEMMIGQYTDWEWNFGRTPPFKATFHNGNTEFTFSVRKGRVVDVQKNNVPSLLTELLKGCRFHKIELLKLAPLDSQEGRKLLEAMSQYSF